MNDFITACIARKKTLDDEITEKENELGELKAARDRIMRDDLPGALHELGLEEVRTADGLAVSISRKLNHSVLDKQALGAWLIKHDYGQLIKDTLAFNRGGLSPELIEYMDAMRYEYARDSKIESQTLAKLLRDLDDAGDDLPPPESVKISFFEEAKVRQV